MSKAKNIDNLIARCKSCQDIQTAERLKTEVVLLLEELEYKSSIIQRCDDITFGNSYVNPFGGGARIDNIMREVSQKITLEQGLNELLDILKDVRKEINYYSLQRKSLIYSAVAAIGTVASIGIALLLHFI